MAEKKERLAFDREKHGLRARVDFVRGTLRAKKDEDLKPEQIARLEDEDIHSLRSTGALAVTDGRGVIDPPASEREAEAAALPPPPSDAAGAVDGGVAKGGK